MTEKTVKEFMDGLINAIRERDYWKARCEQLEQEIELLKKKDTYDKYSLSNGNDLFE